MRGRPAHELRFVHDRKVHFWAADDMSEAERNYCRRFTA